MAGYKQAAAIGAWVLIKIVEQHEEYLSHHEDELNRIQNNLHQGLSFSERGNDRWAHMTFISEIDQIIATNKRLIFSNQEIIDAVLRVKEIHSDILTPLFRKHQHKF